MTRASIRAGRTASATITAHRTSTPQTCGAISVKSFGLQESNIWYDVMINSTEEGFKICFVFGQKYFLFDDLRYL